MGSSNTEFEPPANNKRANPPGSASIQLIIENAETDRVNFKRTIKQLQFGHGAPETRESNSLWVTRFNAFRQHTLKQSLKAPVTGDDLVRFFDAIIRKLELDLLRVHCTTALTFHIEGPLLPLDLLWDQALC